jgi:hypothetical protein
LSTINDFLAIKFSGALPYYLQKKLCFPVPGVNTSVLRIRDPMLFDSWIQKNQDPVSGMNIPDDISKSLETIFWVKILMEAYMHVKRKLILE